MAYEESAETKAVKTAAKRDLGFLKDILKVSLTGEKILHAPCPICGDKTCLQIGEASESPGEWFWKCHKGCGGGDVLSAMKTVENRTFKDVLSFIHKKYGNSSSSAGRPAPRNLPPEQRNGVAAKPVFNKQKADPVLDLPRANDFIEKHHEYLIKRLEIVAENERGLSEDIIRKYKIGYIENERLIFRPWNLSGMLIMGAWVIPITDGKGELKSVRLHFEQQPEGFKGKVMSAPFGTMPAWEQKNNISPIHSWSGLWPDPSILLPQAGSEFTADRNWWVNQIPASLYPKWQMKVEEEKFQVAYTNQCDVDSLPNRLMDQAIDSAYEVMRAEITKAVCRAQNMGEDDIKRKAQWDRYIFICPGELKALAALSAGLMACAPTAGENWTPTQEWLEKFSGQKVCVFYDDDPPKKHVMNPGTPNQIEKVQCTGIDSARKWTSLLLAHGASHVIAKCGGKKEK